MYSYDTRRDVWYREDGLHVTSFAEAQGELYALDESGRVWALRGTRGALESGLGWMAETGLERMSGPERQYLSRYSLCLRLGEGARVTVWLEYDSSGEWVESGTVERHGTGSVTLPIRPRRCDHLRLRLTGVGEAKLLSLTRIREVGGDA